MPMAVPAWATSFRTLLAGATLLRIGLVLYSEWHDAHSVVKYTDVDYRVFSDAARFVLRGAGAASAAGHGHGGADADAGRRWNVAQGPLGAWLGVGDPYTRDTYRYTPLLALLLAPNEWLHPAFGKYLFAACDIVAGVLLHRILLIVTLPDANAGAALSHTPVPSAPAVNDAKTPPAPGASSPPESAEATARHLHRRATILTALHLLNPMVFAISTRGSSEAVLLLGVLLALYAALRARWDAAAVLIGLATHWKIYPAIYAVACLGVVGAGGAGTGGGLGWARRLVNVRTIRFGVLAAGTFLLLGAACYAVWGYPFLYESYLYHLHRRDHRHNFSPYFYLAYLTYPSLNDQGAPAAALPLWQTLLRSPLASFVPQMALALGTGLLFGRTRADLPFAWFVQTFVFVVFNKVCTSQYFLWYLVFVPLLIPRLAAGMTRARAAAALGVWAGAQALWLAEAYRLEFLGANVYRALWARGLVYVAANCWVLAQIVRAYACAA